jgi:transposase
MVSLVFLCWTILATAVGVRPRRDFAGLKLRRQKASRLFAKGKTQSDVARELGVSRQSVSRWYADWIAGGTKALSGAGRAGRMPMLTSAQVEAVRRELEKGPRAHGYPTDLWTLARVAEVIEATTGVSYHHGHVWKILTNRLGWTRQRPARRAVERNDEAIARWVAEDWPRVKKTPDGGRRGSASKTSQDSPSSPR